MYIWDCKTPEDVKLSRNAVIQAEQQFYKNKYLKILNMKYELKDLGKSMAKMKDTEVELKKAIKQKTAIEHNNSHLFITINPKPKADLEEFIKKVIKFTNRNFCDEASAVIEQRGVDETELGKGFHAHIALKRNVNNIRS